MSIHAEPPNAGDSPELAILFNHNPQPMWVYAPDTLAFLAVNEAAQAHYGYSHSEFLGMTLQDIRPTEEISALLQETAQPQSGFSPKRRYRHKKKNGSVINVEISAHDIQFNGLAARLAVISFIETRRAAMPLN